MGDVKLWDSVGADGLPSLRGAAVGFGNTLPKARELCLGRRQRGSPGDKPFQPSTGDGFVSAKEGTYARALHLGCDVRVLLFEVWGGFGPDVVKLLRTLAEERSDKLNKAEYEVATWSTRTWLPFSTQKLSVALHHAAALEVAHALGLSYGADPRA